MLSLTKSTKEIPNWHFLFSIDLFHFDVSAVSCKATGEGQENQNSAHPWVSLPANNCTTLPTERFSLENHPHTVNAGAQWNLDWKKHSTENKSLVTFWIILQIFTAFQNCLYLQRLSQGEQVTLSLLAKYLLSLKQAQNKTAEITEPEF